MASKKISIESAPSPSSDAALSEPQRAPVVPPAPPPQPPQPPPVAPSHVGTLLVIADGFLWRSDLPDSPGALLPDAKEKLLAARARAQRVVIASFCCNTHAGAQRVRGIIERDLQLPLSAQFDLHTAIGFPLFDDVVGAC